MKLLASVAAVAAFLAGFLAMGCEKPKSKLDNVSAEMPSTVGAAPSGTLEQRVAKLEKYAEALDFLQKVYDQQKAQIEAQEASEPAPDAVFAVDISEDVKIGQVEGSPSAYVTIIEAFDFA